MKETTKAVLRELSERYPRLAALQEDVEAAFALCERSYKDGKKLMICGNGGSAADSEHIVGELMKSFKKKRAIPADICEKLDGYGADGATMKACLEGNLPAIALTSHLSLSTAFANDKEPTLTFAQQLLGLGQAGDTLICISTSGNSKNCVYAAVLAKTMGIKVLSLTGEKASKLSELSDVCLRVPETETYKVQELHLPIYHVLCAMLEEEFF